MSPKKGHVCTKIIAKDYFLIADLCQIATHFL